MRQLNNTQYNEKIKQYQQQHHLSEDDFSFSEAKLCDYFKGERMKTYILDALRTSITSNPDNKMKDYIDFEGKGKSLPLSHSTYDKVFLAKFIDSKKILSTPIDFKSEEGTNPRELEIKQISHLLSLITEILYVGKFNQDIGLNRIENRITEQKDSDITDAHLIAYRMSKEEILYAWVPYIINIIQMYFLYNNINFERDSIFQTEFPDQLWNNISNFISNLSQLPLWKDRGMSSTHFSGKKDQKFWTTVFQTGSTPEGVVILTKPINPNELILPTQPFS
jgi:hypothetical protein